MVRPDPPLEPGGWIMVSRTKSRYLTKSRYKLALECPTKLFYAGKPDEYADSSSSDPFLMALARGGFQVGALAKCYFPEGVEVLETDHDKAVDKTNALLSSSGNVTIFEAAVRHGNLFVRVDVLKKVGKTLQVIEVKSKSFDPKDESPFFDKTALKKKVYKLSSDFAPYLYDVAFQAYICVKSHPSFSVSSYLMLPNKGSTTSVEGLNQHFLLRDKDGRASVTVKSGLRPEDLGNEILLQVNVDEAVKVIHEGRNAERKPEDRCQGLDYEDEIAVFAKSYAADERLASEPGSHCKSCEFRADPRDGQKSGYNECWTTAKRLKASDLEEPFVFDIWNFRKAQSLIEDGKILVRDLAKEDIAPVAKDGESGLSMSQRQWLQVEYSQKRSDDPYVDKQALASAFASWTYPLHFIDFETTMTAIPFNKGKRPYEALAFQFSHHVVHEDGKVEHANQYLNTLRGKFPNFDFVRELKKSLEKDCGTIFRYAAHENTVLCQIHEQLRQSNERDAQKLMDWIKTVTISGSSSKEKWSGSRSMVDMCDLVKRYYFHPSMKGSNSIKKVLPAILNASDAIQEKYSKSIYGAKDGIKSLNFINWTWIERCADGSVRDPYEKLPSIYKDITRNEMDFLFGDDELADGGAAMITYAMMQFTEMGDTERAALSQALLRYCELDTLAMVMLYEYWADTLGISKGKKAA
jgi:hypothetical protein